MQAPKEVEYAKYEDRNLLIVLNSEKLADYNSGCCPEEFAPIFSRKKKLTANEFRHKLISQNIDFGLNLLKIICTSDAFHLHLRASV